MTGIKTDKGSPLPLGATVTSEGVNFALFSRYATSVSLVLFEKENGKPSAEIPLDTQINKTGDIWHVVVPSVTHGARYAYRVTGPAGNGHRFNDEQLLLDPYARALEGGEVWGKPPDFGPQDPDQPSFNRRCIVTEDAFDWDGDRPPNIPLKESIIYELHTRGFTVHASSGVRHPGTFEGLIEKIPYFKSLGITAIELLPVFEFNELENPRRNPKTGKPLKNFWGYSTFGFFAPKAAYAADGSDGNPVKAFKELVKRLHAEGMEIILDVVFNHTAEGDETGPTVSFRGLDNCIYYLLDPETQAYLDFSGCGNTVNCNHPVVQRFILDCLHYWVIDMHVDGFRFDLATILNRNQQGELMGGHSLIDMIEQDPVLAGTKIIAEAWDMNAAQVGAFPGRWAEWNSFYRDDVRRFLRGDRGTMPVLATRIAGSSDLYQENGRCPYNSINYITCHDGFTLNDLVSYKRKHNKENAEDNLDGTDSNYSANNGIEGPTRDREINALRLRKMKTAFVLLMASQGVPMILAGDEFARSQKGNNNAYCQDNEISWVDWRLEEQNQGLVRFCRKIITLRKRHPVFRRMHFLSGMDTNGDDHPDLGWHGLEPNKPDWSADSVVLAFLLNGSELAEDRPDDDFFVLLNGGNSDQTFQVVSPPRNQCWMRIIDTSKPAPEDIMDEDTSGLYRPGTTYTLPPGGAAVFICKRGQRGNAQVAGGKLAQ